MKLNRSMTSAYTSQFVFLSESDIWMTLIVIITSLLHSVGPSWQHSVQQLQLSVYQRQSWRDGTDLALWETGVESYSPGHGSNTAQVEQYYRDMIIFCPCVLSCSWISVWKSATASILTERQKLLNMKLSLFGSIWCTIHIFEYLYYPVFIYSWNAASIDKPPWICSSGPVPQ